MAQYGWPFEQHRKTYATRKLSKSKTVTNIWTCRQLIVIVPRDGNLFSIVHRSNSLPPKENCIPLIEFFSATLGHIRVDGNKRRYPWKLEILFQVMFPRSALDRRLVEKRKLSTGRLRTSRLSSRERSRIPSAPMPMPSQ